MEQKEYHWLDMPIIRAFPQFSWEKLIVSVILLLAVLSRFVILGERVMSHDEVNHVVPAYNLYKGMGYAHDPVTHGPFQFHALALSYFFLGDNDFSARVPAALFSIAAICVVLFAFRRYLGRIGALVGGVLFLISPFILYYGRYTRNEAFIELFAVLTFYAFLRYYERKDHFSLYLLAIVTALQFATKETAYIYTAQFLLFCALLFIRDLWNAVHWPDVATRWTHCRRLLLATILFGGGAGLVLIGAGRGNTTAVIVAGAVLLMAGIGIFVYLAIRIVKTLSWAEFRKLSSFNLTIFLGALILPQLAAFPVKILGFDPLDYSLSGMIPTGISLVVLLILSFGIGIWWNRAVFLKSAAAFYILFIFFYSTVFSNGNGVLTGIIGSLGYWLSQQEVQRGGQPMYYYALILLPIYEFAAILGTLLCVYFGAKYRLFYTRPGDALSDSVESEMEIEFEQDAEFVIELEPLESANEPESLPPFIPRTDDGKVPVLAFLLFWTFSALLAYSAAGEKMPWLATHIALPLSLSAAFGFGFLIETAPWRQIFSWNGLCALAAVVSGCYALNGVISALNGVVTPFSGSDLVALKITGQFIFSGIVLGLSALVVWRCFRTWCWRAVLKALVILLSAVLIILQARAAFTASFINYDSAKEYLVYAHSAPGPKIALRQIEEIAERTGQGKAIKVAYDNDSLYPYWWYFRDYTAKNYFGENNPTRDLRDYDAIFINSSRESKLDPIVRDGYYRYQYMRLWWPNQDYWYLSADKILEVIVNPRMREAVFEIWLNRDYTKYAQVTGKTTLTPENWDPGTKMTVYLRKDLMNRMWNFSETGAVAENESETAFADEKFVEIKPVASFGAGILTNPKNAAPAPDGGVYALDSGNNRLIHILPNGSLGVIFDSDAAGGLNQPWGIAVMPDGRILVADTWNHRIVVFDASGGYLESWYSGDRSAQPKGFYGPRAIATSSNGRVYVADTGNKRIMVYNSDGSYFNQFGIGGLALGELDEPVGIALIGDEKLAVADTWNQRVQIFDVGGLQPSYQVLHTFPVIAWYSKTLDNKPYISANADGEIFISDPEGYLIWQYSPEGQLIQSWNGSGGSIDTPSMPTGIFVDSDGAIWVTDALNGVVNRFIINNLES